MNESVGAGEDLGENPEVGDSLDLGEVDPSDLGLLGQLFHHGLGPRNSVGVGTEDGNPPGILHVDLGARRLLDGSDDLATGANDVADPIRLDPQDLESRGKLVQRRPGSEVAEFVSRLLAHAIENMQSTVSSLRQCALHHGPVALGHLDVHLPSRDPVPGTRDLEVHVAEVILVSEDV